MTKVVIIKNWQEPNLLRQTPNSSGVWNNIHFTFEEEVECDYVIVLNYSPKLVKLLVPPENVWCLMQEPPNEYFKYRHKANKIYSRVFSQDPTLIGKRYVHTQPALPWHVDKSYDFLKEWQPAKKPFKLSCITSNKRDFQGQRRRMEFLEKVKSRLPLDIFGKGINPIKDKWDALSPYRYSLVIENFKGPNYWSEKLADSFLAWTMPIYYGCTNIEDYFPKGSLVRFDINDPGAIDKIREVISTDRWYKNREAIRQARELVLEKYQFFPFISEKIKEWEKKKKNKSEKERVIIPNEDTFLMNNSIVRACRALLDSAINSLTRRIIR